MDWLDKRNAQFEQAMSDKRMISLHAERMFTELWSAIIKVVEAAQEKGYRLITNGFPKNRKVLMAIGNVTTYEEPNVRILHIALAEDLRSVSAVADGNVQKIAIEVCSDGVICFKHEGKAVTNTEAAQLFMEPFLFEGTSPYRVV